GLARPSPLQKWPKDRPCPRRETSEPEVPAGGMRTQQGGLRPCWRGLLDLAEQIAFADLDAVVAKNAVGGSEVEIQIGHDHHLHEAEAGEGEVVTAREVELDGVVFTVIDLFRLEAVNVIERFLHAGDKLRHRFFGVWPRRRFYSREAGHGAFDRVGSDLYLFLQRIHVRRQARVWQYRGIKFFGVGESDSLVQDAEQICQRVRKSRNSQLVHRNRHCISSISWWSEGRRGRRLLGHIRNCARSASLFSRRAFPSWIYRISF